MLFIRILLLLLVAFCCHGFAPLPLIVVHSDKHGSIARRTAGVRLDGKRKRVKSAYRSIRKRLQRKRDVSHQPKVISAKDRQVFLNSLQDGHCGSFTPSQGDPHYSKLLGKDTLVAAGTATAIAEIASSIDETLVLADIPLSADIGLIGLHATQNGEDRTLPLDCGSVALNMQATANNTVVTPPPMQFAEAERLAVEAQLEKDPPTAEAPKKERNVEELVAEVICEPLPISEEMEPLKSLYTLPPIDRGNLTKLEAEFRDMLEYFCQFTEGDLLTIRDPRIRAIMEGVVSGSTVVPVYRAFEVLFEDLPPLRLAGRMIYGKLKNLMLKAQERAQKEVNDIVKTTGLEEERVQVSRVAFLTLAIPTEQGKEKEAYLTVEQLVDSGLAEKAMESLGYDNVTDFLTNIDPRQTGKVTFPQLMTGLQTTAEDACSVDRCDPALVLQSVVQEMDSTLATTTIKLDRKRQEISDRYDHMVVSFQEWDDIVPEGEGRRLDVLRGCFVGAANHRVVEALRVVYLDYGALRLAGNSIFAIMKTLVGKIRRRKANH